MRCESSISAKVVNGVIYRLRIARPHVFDCVHSEAGNTYVDQSVEIRDDFTANVLTAELQVQQTDQTTVTDLQRTVDPCMNWQPDRTQTEFVQYDIIHRYCLKIYPKMCHKII